MIYITYSPYQGIEFKAIEEKVINGIHFAKISADNIEGLERWLPAQITEDEFLNAEVNATGSL